MKRRLKIGAAAVLFGVFALSSCGVTKPSSASSSADDSNPAYDTMPEDYVPPTVDPSLPTPDPESYNIRVPLPERTPEPLAVIDNVVLETPYPSDPTATPTVTAHWVDANGSPVPVANDTPEILGSVGQNFPPVSTPDLPDIKVVSPYEVGQIMIIMYHGITPDDAPDPPYHRTVSEFKADLQALYDGGYRLCPLRDIMSGNIATEAGYTPVALTFDDGLPSAFSLENDPLSGSGFKPAENTAYALLNDFVLEHPDFGFYATFFINGYDPFRGEGSVGDRLDYLTKFGNCDVGNHTKDHHDLYDAYEKDPIGLQEQIAFVDKLIDDNLPPSRKTDRVQGKSAGLSYPYGSRPAKAFYPLVTDGVFDGHAYHYDFALREGPSGAPSAYFRYEFDPLNVPRVRGSNNDKMDLGWFLEYYENSPEYRYISDGDPNTVVVPREYEHNVDEEKVIREGKVLITY